MSCTLTLWTQNITWNIYVQTYELVFYHKTAEIQYRYKLLMPYISFIKRYKYSPWFIMIYCLMYSWATSKTIILFGFENSLWNTLFLNSFNVIRRNGSNTRINCLDGVPEDRLRHLLHMTWLVSDSKDCFLPTYRDPGCSKQSFIYIISQEATRYVYLKLFQNEGLFVWLHLYPYAHSTKIKEQLKVGSGITGLWSFYGRLHRITIHMHVKWLGTHSLIARPCASDVHSP